MKLREVKREDPLVLLLGLMKDLKNKAKEWDKSNTYTGKGSQGYDDGYDSARMACAEELEDLIKKYGKFKAKL